MTHPPLLPARKERLYIRANPDQESLLSQAAASRHMKLSQFVLQTVLSGAKRIL